MYEYEIVLDVNTDVYPIREGGMYKVGITNAINLDDEEGDYYSIDNIKETSFKDYGYVMHGKVFRYELHEDNKISQYISFGGLILKIKGDVKYLKSLEIDSKVFLMMEACS